MSAVRFSRIAVVGLGLLGGSVARAVRAHLPAAPAFAGHAQQLLQRRSVAGQHHLLQRIERLAKALRLLEHLFPVG
jgi:prephenate dehydrogenase